MNLISSKFSAQLVCATYLSSCWELDAALWQINMDSDSEEDDERKQGKDKNGNVEEQEVEAEDSEMAKKVHAASTCI